MKNTRTWNRNWGASIQVRKQRLHQRNAPLHAKGAFLASHLSKELSAKHKRRALRVRKGDKVLVLRGEHKGKSGRVERVDVKQTRVFIASIELTRRDGTKSLISFHPSKLLIQELAADKR